MENWLALIGIVLSIVGTIIIIKGELTNSAAQIKFFWSDLQKGW